MNAKQDYLIDQSLKRVFERIERELSNPIDESEIVNTNLYKHYKNDIIKMEVDPLLDWRNRLCELREMRGNYPIEWFNDEIKCVDWLLNKIV